MVAGSTILAGAALLTLGPVTAGGTADTTAAIVQEQKLAQTRSVPIHWLQQETQKWGKKIHVNKIKESKLAKCVRKF